jgi:hypothetical protein
VVRAISAYCHDSEIAIVRISLRHLIRARWVGLPRLLIRLVNSGNREMRELASHYLAGVGFDKLWQGWPFMPADKRLAVGRALIKIDPLFHAHLTKKLLSSVRNDRLRAMAIIHGLNQGFLFEPGLIAMTKDQDKLIVSAAVRALGSVESREALRTLETTLGHFDSRVRANTIESLHQLRATGHVPRLIAMADQEENRPRANAIHTLLELKTGRPLDSLGQMLHDDRPAQRSSALWVVEKQGLVELAHPVAEISIADPDGAIRKRAGSIIHHMIESMVEPSPALAA